VTYTDPYIATLAHGSQTLRSVPENDALTQGADCYVICTHHDAFDYDTIVKRASLIVDTRNALRSYPGSSIFRL
jgi:UDP-N-acetyl-D-glucosamine dehydrogenase